MIDPYQEALKIYRREECKRSFLEDMLMHLRNPTAYIFKTPEFFVMGRAVRKGAPYRLITDPSIEFEDPDCWFFHVATGQIDKFLNLEPFPLEWVGFERNNDLRYYYKDHIREVATKVALKQ